MKTRTKSFILSFTLLLAMLIGVFAIMPMTASAASDTITIDGLTAPQAGQSVMEWAGGSFPVFSTDCDLADSGFFQGEFDEFVELMPYLDEDPFLGNFVSGQSYTLWIYIASETPTLPENAELNVPGATSAVYEYAGEDEGTYYAHIMIVYTVGGGAAPTITVTGLPAPQAEQSVEEWWNSISAPPTLSGGVTWMGIKYMLWIEGEYDNGDAAEAALTANGPFEGTFADGKKYTFYAAVAPSGSEPVPAAATVVADGASNTAYQKISNDFALLFLTYTVGAEPITITGFPVPQVGQTAEQWGASITTPPTISPALDWEPIAFVEAKINTYEEFMAFVEGGGQPYTAPFTNKQYTLILGAKANGEVALPRYGAVSAAGTSSTGYAYIEDPEGDYAYIFLTYTLGGGAEVVDRVVGVPVPLAGDNAEDYAENIFSILSNTYAFSAECRVAELSDDLFTGDFVAGTQYKVAVKYNFLYGAPAALNFTVDGADNVEYIRIDENNGVIIITFTAKEFSGTVIESVDVTLPEIGTDLIFGTPVMTDNENITATMTFITMEEGMPVTRIEEGKVYGAYLFLEAKNGAALSLDSIKLNGKELTEADIEGVRSTANGTVIMFAYAFGEVDTLNIGDVGLVDGEYLANGSSTPTTTKPATGGYAYWKDGVLTLHDFVYESNAEGERFIYSQINDNMDIVLEGNNVINCPNYSDVIDVNETLVIGGSGTLTLTGDENAINAEDLIVNGGTITINAYYDCVMLSSFTINGGTITLNAESEAIYSYNGITMTGGTLTVNAAGESEYAIRAQKGVTISNATMTVNKTDNDLPIFIYQSGITINAGGTLNVNAPDLQGSLFGSSCYEVNVNGGTLNVTTNSGCLYVINDIIFNGTVNITAAFDYAVHSSRGNIYVNGGTVEIKNRAGRAFTSAPVIASGLYAYASNTVNGTMNPYVAANNNTYRHVVIDSIAKVGVFFNSNGGTGLMGTVTLEEGDSYTLPECTFTAPEGCTFKCWSIGGVEYAPGATVTINDNTEILAVWKGAVTDMTLSADSVRLDDLNSDETNYEYTFTLTVNPTDANAKIDVTYDSSRITVTKSAIVDGVMTVTVKSRYYPGAYPVTFTAIGEEGTITKTFTVYVKEQTPDVTLNEASGYLTGFKWEYGEGVKYTIVVGSEKIDYFFNENVSRTVEIKPEWVGKTVYVYKANANEGANSDPKIIDIPADLYTYDVILPESPVGYEINLVGGSTVKVDKGGSFSFSVNILEGYKKSEVWGYTFAVRANGKIITDVDGVYTVSDITSDITITVENVAPLVRTEVTEFVGTSTIGTPKYGEEAYAKGATFTFTVGTQAHISTSMSSWVKWDGTAYKRYDASVFSDGTYRFNAQLRIDGTDGLSYVIGEGATLIIDGKEWTVTSSVMKDEGYSFVWVQSPDFVIEYVEIPLAFEDNQLFDIDASYVGRPIESFSVAASAVGGKAPYTFTKVSGPAWITVNADGTVSGTPTAVGDNADLVIRCTDANSNYLEITIDVDKTYINPEDRTEVSEFEATTNMATPTVGGAVSQYYNFTFTKGTQANVPSSMSHWYKWNGTEWVRYDEATFTPGKYYFSLQLRIDDDYGRNYVLADEIAIVIDGVAWKTSAGSIIEDYYSFTWVKSPTFTVGMAETVYYVGFNANGGEGEMASLTHDMATGKYTLPECGFTAPANKGFKAWNVNGVEYPAGAQIELTEDIVVKAIWASYRVAFSGNNFTAGQMSATILPGQSFTTTVTPSVDYKLPDEIEVKIGETKLVLGTDYTYDKASGVITVNASAITGDLSIRVDAILAKYSVTISATNATFTADEKMTIGEDYVVNFTINSGYEFSSLIVKRSSTYVLKAGEEYTYENGVLTIFAEQITGPFQIWFSAKEKATAYDVTFKGDHYTHNGSNKADIGSDYVVTFTPDTGYDIDNGDIVVKYTAGTAVQGWSFADGVLTIPAAAITGDIEISVYPDLIPTEWNVTFKGDNFTENDEDNKAQVGVDYTVKLTPAGGYEIDNGDIVVKYAAGTAVQGWSFADGVLTIPAAAITGDIEISVSADLIHVHNYGDEWKKDANNHWLECSCGDKKDSAAHTGVDDGDCTTAITCSVCGTETTPAKATHTGGTATCTAKAKCSVCNKEYGELVEHKYSEATCTAKAKCSVCGDEKGELAPHTYVDGKCACGATDPNYVPPHEHTFVEGKCECGETDPNYTPGTDIPGGDEPGTDDPNAGNTEDPTDDNDGLPTGAIIAIVAGSVVVGGAGIFALVWFVIKKKTWAEFLAIFKKG